MLHRNQTAIMVICRKKEGECNEQAVFKSSRSTSPAGGTEKSVCVGMSMLYANLCHAADLPCKFVRFKTGEVEHNLNYVPDINGDAYYVDITENHFLLSDAADMLAGKVDKAYSDITRDCTDHTFEYSDGSSESLESTNLKECHNKPYRDWFNEYALHNKVDPKKVFSTAYVEKGSGDGTKHASYRNFSAYPAQRYSSRSSGVTGIWFLDDFYEEPETIRSRILNKELDGQLLVISGIEDHNQSWCVSSDASSCPQRGTACTYHPAGEMLCE